MTNFKNFELEEYIATAIWSSSDDEGTPLDELDYELSPEAREIMATDLRKFFSMVSQDTFLCAHTEVLNGHLPHDFWLTRNRFGEGFYENDYPETHDRLTEITRQFSEQYIYIGADDMLHIDYTTKLSH